MHTCCITLTYLSSVHILQSEVSTTVVTVYQKLYNVDRSNLARGEIVVTLCLYLPTGSIGLAVLLHFALAGGLNPWDLGPNLTQIVIKPHKRTCQKTDI